VTTDFRDFTMTCPFGLDTITIALWLRDGCDCHHAPGLHEKTP
jgi:hypothetical protein